MIRPGGRITSFFRKKPLSRKNHSFARNLFFVKTLFFVRIRNPCETACENACISPGGNIESVLHVQPSGHVPHAGTTNGVLKMYLTGLLLLVFFVNVTMGAFFGNPFLDDVGEMLFLLGAAVAFAIVVLKQETKARQQEQQRQQ